MDWEEAKARLPQAADTLASMRDWEANQDAVAIRAALQRVEEQRKEIEAWRHFAWLIHGHSDALYGDDGERQCQLFDFNRHHHERLIGHASETIQESHAALRQRVEELERGNSRLSILLEQRLEERERAEAEVRRLEGLVVNGLPEDLDMEALRIREREGRNGA